MAAKRASPLDNPPAASSSDEDVESSSEEEEEERKGKQQQTNPTEEEVDDDEEEEESEDGDEEEGESEHKPEKKNQSLLTHTHKNPSVKIPKPQSSSSDAEGDDDDGSESESYSAKNMKSPGASDFTVKPVVSKHVNAVGKPKTATSKPAVSKPAATPSKRPTPESSLPNGKASKSKKPKGSNNDEEEVVAVEKKASTSRLWSEDDEIAILKGMLDFQTEKGMDPYSDSAAFHEFIKSSLSVDVTRNQLMDKGRRMKKKFKNNVERGENGKDPVFSKPHEQKSFALSKKIWGSFGYTKNNNSDGAEENAKSSSRNATWKSNKANNSNAGVDATLSTHKEEAIVTQDQGKAKAEHEERKSELVELYPFFADLLRLHAFPNMHLGELGMKFSEKRLTSRGKPMLKALEDKCRKLKVAESELLLERLQLVKEGTSLVMDLIKSPEH
ncbi:hypothetical protein Nepgr_012886 [Nepenthes gracilis]|uniref:Glabrous enhancer-binding protein-like DBD domain-containing protein n=1 Tax=Nepenthes gracilis TaxID=150966 RepID=A0AAD3SGJ1_NEPGR|nr:hypothetical protein Nepgr_012886 [Nepenthes gracilis]